MATYRIQGKHLALEGDFSACAHTVTDCGAVWRMSGQPYVLFNDGRKANLDNPAEEGTFRTGITVGAFAVFRLPGKQGITVRTTVEIERQTDDVYYTVMLTGDARGEIDCVSYPAPFDFGLQHGAPDGTGDNHLPHAYTVLPRMQGMLIPAGMKVDLWGGQVFERDSYMPFFGQVRGDAGYLAIYDTPFDVKYELRNDDGEKVAPLWLPSLGVFTYQRKLLVRFMQHCSYNDFAASYRQYVKERGNLVTLREKIARNPQAERLIGCPVIHEQIAVHIPPESRYYQPGNAENNDNFVPFSERAGQIRALRARGLTKAYTHFDGWGSHGYDNLHPSPLPPHAAAGGYEGMRALNEAVRDSGYLFGIHDQYRDYYYDAPDFSFDDAAKRADGTLPFSDVWYGGSHTVLCSSVARDYVRRNYRMFRDNGVQVDAAYLDVFSVVQLDECFNDDHPVTRAQCAEHRRECLDQLTAQGIIPSSEEVLDCILPSQVLCHHAPFVTRTLGATDDEAVGIPIPLLNLVYHDCVVTPWIGKKGERGGWGIPRDLSAYAYAILNGNPVYIAIDADEATIADVQVACAIAEKLALVPMVWHEFVSQDRRVQRTTFADGTVIEVDVYTGEYAVGQGRADEGIHMKREGSR